MAMEHEIDPFSHDSTGLAETYQQALTWVRAGNPAAAGRVLNEGLDQSQGEDDDLRVAVLLQFGSDCLALGADALAERLWTQGVLDARTQAAHPGAQALLWLFLAELFLSTGRPGLAVTASRRGVALGLQTWPLTHPILAESWLTWMAAMRQRQHEALDLAWYVRN